MQDNVYDLNYHITRVSVNKLHGKNKKLRKKRRLWIPIKYRY